MLESPSDRRAVWRRRPRRFLAGFGAAFAVSARRARVAHQRDILSRAFSTSCHPNKSSSATIPIRISERWSWPKLGLRLRSTVALRHVSCSADGRESSGNLMLRLPSAPVRILPSLPAYRLGQGNREYLWRAHHRSAHRNWRDHRDLPGRLMCSCFIYENSRHTQGIRRYSRHLGLLLCTGKIANGARDVPIAER